MPLISNVGRRSLKTKLICFAIYAVLSLGSLTMLYPFALMISTSVKSYGDYKDFSLIPKYLYDSHALFKKYIADKTYPVILGIEYGRQWYSAEDIITVTGKDRTYTAAPQSVSIPEMFAKPRKNLDAIIGDWKEFSGKCPELYKFALFSHTGPYNYSVLDIKPDYWKWLRKKYGSIDALNKAYTDNAVEFEEVSLPYEDQMRQRWLLPIDRKYLEWQEFKKDLPYYMINVISGEIPFQQFLRTKFPLLKNLSKAIGSDISEYSELTLSRAYKKRELPPDIYEEFVKRKCPVIFLRLDPSLEPEFKAFIRDKYKSLSQSEMAVRTFSALCPMDTEYSGRANDWIEFMEKEAPVDKISFVDPMFMYQDFLRGKYKSVENMNAAYLLKYKDFPDVVIPRPWIDLNAFSQNKSGIFWKYLTGNYTMVLTLITVHGRALMNTIIYIVLAIMSALTVNPLAAYALSRYKLRYTNKILLFLLATMALPASVGMIPGFLLLKNLGLLNTFAALILPGLANGYSIFLLKGFFDSVPAELYEAALIDRADEMTIFLRIVLPLTTPILAIIALGAFSSAYSSFMFAFLSCQDPKMWTLMVFLYEFQQSYPTYLVMASLVVAAIPTLLVFIFCQNIIMRGIVVPSFK